MLNLLMFLPFACNGDDKDSQEESDVDTDTDADTDADTDTDTDADTDADTTDPEWEHCPEATGYEGDTSWPWALEVTRDAVYCSAWNEERTLEQELAAKMYFKIVKGTYPLPTVKGDGFPLALPVCSRMADPLLQPAMIAKSGTASVTVSSFGDLTTTWITAEQPLTSAATKSWTFQSTFSLAGEKGASPNPVTLDGDPYDLATGSTAQFLLYQDGTSVYDVTTIDAQPCFDETWTKNTHTITFDGGAVTLELWLGSNLTATAPGAFAHAYGNLDGSSFDSDEYFQLIYRPDHHHFNRHFAVLFDEPIGDACALRVEDVSGLDKAEPTANVHTAGCGLESIEERKVLTQTLEVAG